MLNAELKTNSLLFPKGFVREYDAHVYFDLSRADVAGELRERAMHELGHLPIFIGPLYRKLVGPHTLPMFEINFSRDDHARVFEWLRRNRAGHSVLVHEVTGDDWRDHGEGAEWLGPVLRLDTTKFDPRPVR